MRVRSGLAALLLALVPAAPALSAPESDGIKIGAVRAQLYYQHSGTFSEDLIARKPPFRGWNTGEGEGDAKEPSEHLLVVATLVNSGAEHFTSDKVTLRVTDEIEQEVRVKEFSGVLLPANGTLQLPMWLDDAACLGTVTVTATFREQSVSGTLDMLCGT